MDYGIWSLVPPILALGLAFATRQVYLSLFTGILGGYFIIEGWHPWSAFVATLEAFIKVFEDAGNTRTILFCILVGALIELVEANGGVRGFIAFFGNRLAEVSSERSKRKIELFAFMTGAIIFVESSISILTVGTIFRPLFDKYGISRERLAYIADSCSAPICILLPFNAWGAYVLGILEDYEISQPVKYFVGSIKYNFYPFLALGVLLFLIYRQKSYGPLKAFVGREVVIPEGQPESTENNGNMWHMLLPLLSMVLMMPIMLAYSGWRLVSEMDLAFFPKVGQAIVSGSGSFSVLVAVTIAVVIAAGMTMFTFRKDRIEKIINLCFLGMGKLLPLGVLMMLAFALNTLCKELGTGIYIAEQLRDLNAPVMLLPVLLFLVSGITAFSTGTSWGTFAIMLGIAIPVSLTMDVSLALCLGAVLGGGVFGDHCSPISDTTIIASTAAECRHIDHVRTQIPFAVSAGIVAAIFYVIMGIVVL